MREADRSLSALLRDGRYNATRRLFDGLPARSIVTWNSFLAALARHRDVRTVQEFFNAMPVQDKLEKLEKEGLIEKPFQRKQLKIRFPERGRSGRTVLTVRNLEFRFGDKKLFDNANLMVERGEKIAITGPNGCGKSTLLKLILGMEKPQGAVRAPMWGPARAATAARWLTGGKEAMGYDVVVVGAGPAGLAAAIRLKQLCRATDTDLSIRVLKKGSRALITRDPFPSVACVIAHQFARVLTLSGNVFEPRALDELIPQWRQEGVCLSLLSKMDKFHVLFGQSAVYTTVTTLSQLLRWMAVKAEELGVEVYLGFAASELLRNAGLITLLVEGCRGSLSKKIVRNHKLRESGQGQHQTYALGIKEVS
ncbi:hypothetical protein ABZP36_002512 [Zizania latifolia]